MPNIAPDTHIQSVENADTGYEHHGSVTFITNEARDLFLIQKKDYEYRVPAYRGGYSLFGGGLEHAEFPRDALNREITEEILLPDVTESILASARAWQSFQLFGSFRHESSVQSFSFSLFVYEAILANDKFKRTVNAMTKAENITEGSAHCVTADQLIELAISDEQDKFIFNIGRVIRAYQKYLSSCVPV